MQLVFAPNSRAEDSQLSGSFAGPSSTCEESSRRIELWLALFPGFHRPFKGAHPTLSLTSLFRRFLANV